MFAASTEFEQFIEHARLKLIGIYDTCRAWIDSLDFSTREGQAFGITVIVAAALVWLWIATLRSLWDANRTVAHMQNGIRDIKDKLAVTVAELEAEAEEGCDEDEDEDEGPADQLAAQMVADMANTTCDRIERIHIDTTQLLTDTHKRSTKILVDVVKSLHPKEAVIQTVPEEIVAQATELFKVQQEAVGKATELCRATVAEAVGQAKAAQAQLSDIVRNRL